MSYPYSNAIFINGVGVDGATVSAYDISRFTEQPGLNTPVPGGSPDAGPITTSPTFGYDGKFTINLPTTDLYYIAVENDGLIYWDGPAVGAGAGGSGGSGGGNGEVLNSISYGPSSPVGYSLTTTLAAIDTTHLTISFTVPADGQVTIEADVPVGIGVVGAQGIDVEMAFFEHGTTTLASPREQLLAFDQTATSDAGIDNRVTYKATVTELTADASLQWDLAALSSIAGADLAADDGTTGTNSNGPIIITVYGPAASGDGDDLPLTGGTLTGALFIETEGDANPRVTVTEAGLVAISSPAAPVNWGTHVSGDVGSGTDFGLYFEQLGDTANTVVISSPRVRLTDGTNYLHLSAPAYPTGLDTLNTTQDVAVDTGSMAALASSGTLTVTSVLYGNGTLSYTGKTGTGATGTLTGCTSSGISATATDTSERSALLFTDEFGQQVFAIGGGQTAGGIGGAFLTNNDMYFAYTGITTPSTEYDIAIGFLNYVTRDTGSGIFFGSDGNMIMRRTTDGSSNPQWMVTLSGDQYIAFTLNGLFPYTAIGLGTTANPWGVANISGLNLPIVAKSSAYTLGALDSTVVVTGTTTITLPTAVGISGREYTIVNGGSGVVSLATTSSQDINGAPNYTLSTQWSSLTVQSNNVGWITTGSNGTIGGGGGGGDYVPANLQTATYTPVATDLGKVIEMNSSSATEVILDAGVFSAGDTFEVCQVGTGAVTFVEGGGGTIDIALVANTSNYGTPLSALAVDPAGVGNVLLLAIYVSSTSVTGTPSGGGCATWTQVGTGIAGTDTAYEVQLWMGTVTTAGSSTIDITWTGTIGTDFTYLSCHEFESGLGTSTTWAIDVHGTVNTTSTSTAITFPSLTATGSEELYFATIFDTHNITAGSTSGYDYYGGGSQEMMVWNTDVSGTQAPTATSGTAGYYNGVGVILSVSGSSFTIDSYDDYLQILGQWASATVRYRSGSEAVISGALTS